MVPRGYGLDERLPNHSSLTKIRQRLGLPLFRRFFEQVVQLCIDAGLVWGKELVFDATKVRANASADSVVPRVREVVDDHLVELFGPEQPHDAAVAAIEGAGPCAPAGVPSEAETSGRTRLLHPAAIQAAEEPAAAPVAPPLTEDTAPARWALLEACRLASRRPAVGSCQRLSDQRISTTDPDAVLTTSCGQRAAVGYHDHPSSMGARPGSSCTRW